MAQAMTGEVQAEPEAAEGPELKVVEISTVTDEELESVLNEWIPKGYLLDGIHFAMRESSRRPSMAFLVFQRKKAPRGPG